MKQPLKPQIQQTKFKSEAFITKIILNINISSILVGFPNACFNALDFTQFSQIFEIQEHQALYQGIITGAIALTASMGGILSSYLLQRFSRINCFLIVNAVYTFSILGLMIKNVNAIILFRLLQGCAVGIYSSIIPLYNKQFSPLQINAKMGTFYQMLTVTGLCLGFFLAYFFSLFLTAQVYWRLVFGFPLILLAIQSYNLIYNYNYQTPKYLLSVQKYQETNDLLGIIYKEQYVQQRLQQLKRMLQLSSNKSNQMIKMTGNEIIQQNQAQPAKQIKYHNNKLAIYAAFHVATLQQFSGISVVIGYGGQIVKRVLPSLFKILPVFLHGEAILACLVTIRLLKSYGRKDFLQYGSIGCGIFTLVLGYNIVQLNEQGRQINIGTGLLILMALFLYRFVYGVTLGAVAFLYIAQIVEPNIMPLVTIIYWLIAFLTLMFFPILRVNVFNGNPGPIFIFFGIYTLMSYVINHFIVVETKGKKQYQVRLQYDRKLGIKRQ